MINNIYPQSGTSGSDWYSAKACMSWTWYLAVDFQLYLISPIFVIIFWKHRKVGWCVVAFTLLSAIGVQIWLAMHFHYSMNPFHYQNTVDEYHTVASIKPYTRCVPYLMGLGAAMIFHNEAGRLKRGHNRQLSSAGSETFDSPDLTPDESPPQRRRMSGASAAAGGGGITSGSVAAIGAFVASSKCVLFGFVAAITSILVVIFLPATDYWNAVDSGGAAGHHNNNDHHHHHLSSNTTAVMTPIPHTVISNWSDFVSVVYAVFSHVVIGLSMTFIVLAFSLGHGGWLRELAKAQWWQPLSRLTFGVYLVHPMIIFFSCVFVCFCLL